MVSTAAADIVVGSRYGRLRNVVGMDELVELVGTAGLVDIAVVADIEYTDTVQPF